jgi:GTP cyclohydrolase I
MKSTAKPRRRSAGDERPVSARIRDRLRAAQVPFAANDAIGQHLQPGEIEALEQEVRDGVAQVLGALVIDTERDHNTQGTAARVAKMYVREVFAGRYAPAPRLTDFPNVKKLDQLYTVGPITVRSACSHHFCPVQGDVWIGVIPGDRVIGLSKFARIAEWVMARPQIQEEAIVQLADEIERVTKPKGLAIVMRATHTCMTWRGVREHDTTMTNNVMRGILREAPAARAEFFSTIGGQGFTCR